MQLCCLLVQVLHYRGGHPGPPSEGVIHKVQSAVSKDLSLSRNKILESWTCQTVVIQDCDGYQRLLGVGQCCSLPFFILKKNYRFFVRHSYVAGNFSLLLF